MADDSLNTPTFGGPLTPPTQQPPAPPAAGPHSNPTFVDPQASMPATQPVVPPEPVSTTLVDAWPKEQAAPQGPVNPPSGSALPGLHEVTQEKMQPEVLPPMASQMPGQAPLAPDPVVSEVTQTAPLAVTDEQPVEVPEMPLAEDAVAAGDGEQSGDDKKSPLEILEEILAGANAEKDLKEKEEAQKKEIAEREAAEFAAKAAAFATETQQKLAATAGEIEAAKQQRQQVVANEEANAGPSTDISDDLEINQLKRDTIQSTE